MLLNNESSVDVKRVEDIVQTINLYDENLVRYGSSVQENFAALTDKALKSVIELNPKEIDRIILEINDIIDKANVGSSKKSLLGAFRPARKKGSVSKEKCMETSKVLDEKNRELDGKRMKVRVNLEILESFHQQNLGYYEDLEYHILAGKQKLQKTRESELEQLRQKAEETKTPEDIAAYNYLQDRIETFEERICSLETTKTMSSQMVIQVRLMRNSNEQLMQQIDGGNNLISAWRQSAMIGAGR